MTRPNPPETLISVRAEATHEVQPDVVRLHTVLSVVAPGKAASHDAVDEALRAVTDELAGLGGVVLTAGTGRQPLTWTAGAIRTHAGRKRDASGERQPRHRGTVELRIVVRDFTLLPRLDRLVSATPSMSMHYASWSVDDDNPGWASVRAAAIRAALRQGQDYAAALGGEIRSVEHVADAGLLGDVGGGRAVSLGFVAQSGDDFESDARSLGPRPQRLQATIDARFVASAGPLPR